jgi:hypothetical protein
MAQQQPPQRFIYTKTVRDQILNLDNHTADYLMDRTASNPVHVDGACAAVTGEIERLRQFGDKRYLTLEDLQRIMLTK